MIPLPRATQLAHELISSCLSAGDTAVDATAGNGHDTRFLADCVGTEGRVHAFDIQEEAISQTRNRCADLPQVLLHHSGHERIDEHVKHPIQAAMFNLGYLPKGDKSKVTLPETTLVAVESCLEHLSPGGRITIILYTGHPGGKNEALAVRAALQSLDQEDFTVAQYCFLNQANSPPELLVVERRQSPQKRQRKTAFRKSERRLG